MKQITLEKITHLIPLSEFLNHVKQLEKPIDQPFEAFKLFQLGLIFRYTTFLEQPLELCQFVAVGGNGEVLEEPELNELYSIEEAEMYEQEKYQYELAKERCIFEGFEWKEPCELYRNGKLVWFGELKGKIEDILSLKPGLTQSALKQIY